MPSGRITCLTLLITTATALTAQDLARYDLEKESALGSQLAAEIARRSTPLQSAIAQQFLDSIGQRLAAAMPYAQHPFTFRAIADDRCPQTHEPTALPGGHVFVPAALFTATTDEAEFAGMLAHAMEHSAQRHGFRQASLASVPLIFVGDWRGCLQKPNSTPAELDADSWAIRAMAAAGFNPEALLRYVERIEPLSTRDTRVAALRAAIEKSSPVIVTVPLSPDFAAVRQEVRRLTESRKRPPSLLP